MPRIITRRMLIGGSLLLVVILSSISAARATTYTNENLSRNPYAQTEQIKSIIHDVFEGEPRSVINTITRICMCESGGRNKAGKPTGTIVHIEPDGSVREGMIDGDDRGACQINPTTHSKHFWARNQLDPDNVRDNIRYALALIDDKRARGRPLWEDWTASRRCWES